MAEMVKEGGAESAATAWAAPAVPGFLSSSLDPVIDSHDVGGLCRFSLGGASDPS